MEDIEVLGINHAQIKGGFDKNCLWSNDTLMSKTKLKVDLKKLNELLKDLRSDGWVGKFDVSLCLSTMIESEFKQLNFAKRKNKKRV